MVSAYAPGQAAARPWATAYWLAWVNVLIGALAMVATLPGRTIGLGLITEPLLRDLRLDRVDYGMMNLWATLIGSTFSLVFGPLVDRVGSRLVLALNLLLLAVAVHWMARVEGTLELAASLTLTRGLGQSALSVVSLALVGKRARRLDAAMAVFAATVAVGFIAAVPGTQYAVEAVGWRAAWSGIGWTILAFAVVAWLLVRGGDGATDSTSTDAPAAASEATHDDFTLVGALATSTFWVLAVSCAAFNLLFSAVSLFCEAILQEKGLYDPGTFRTAMGGLAAGGIVGNAAAAWLARRLTLSRLLGIGMLVVAISIALLAAARTTAVACGAASLLGIAGGVVTVVFFACWPTLFGRRHVGTVQGAAQVMTVLLSAVGPILLATGERRQGSYAATLMTMAPVFVVLAVACWIAPAPKLQTK